MAAASAAHTLASAFNLPTNVKDAADFIKNFDFSKLSVVSKEKLEGFHFDLAPSFGKLDKEHMKHMDDNLKIIISGTTRAIERLQDKSWENVKSTLSQNPLLEPMGDEIYRSDKMIKSDTSAFKFDGSPDANIVREVQAWLVELVQDEDILTCTGMDVDVLAKIVASSGARVDSFETFFAKKESHEQKVIDIGVLRYPDTDHPYFKVYRMQLVAWSDCSRILFVQDDKNGITGDLRVRKYKPRESVLSGLREETRKKAIEEAEKYFDS